MGDSHYQAALPQIGLVLSTVSLRWGFGHTVLATPAMFPEQLGRWSALGQEASPHELGLLDTQELDLVCPEPKQSLVALAPEHWTHQHEPPGMATSTVSILPESYRTD